MANSAGRKNNQNPDAVARPPESFMASPLKILEWYRYSFLALRKKNALFPDSCVKAVRCAPFTALARKKRNGGHDRFRARSEPKKKDSRTEKARRYARTF